jgi:MOSC domain-containing protein YiiM
MKESNQKPVTRNQKGKIKAVSISKEKGTKKTNVLNAVLKDDFGIIGDSHVGTKKRQVSLLAEESIKKMRDKGLKVKPGDFAENITTEGIDLLKLGIGTKIKVGENAILEISQIGKDCHSRCSIYYQAGDCIMPREGIFAKVLTSGIIKPGDEIVVDS